MSTKEITGVIKMLGNSSTQNQNYTNYSLIEFDDGTVVQSVLVSNRMDNFLRTSLASGANTKLFLQGRRLYGAVFDGKAYVDRIGYQSPILSIIFMLIGLGLCVVLIGIFIVWANINNFQHGTAIQRFQDTYPAAIVL